MGSVINRTQRVGHGVGNAQTDIGECHTGNKLAQSHTVPSGIFIFHSAAQIFGDQANRFQIQAIGQFPCGFGDITFNGVGEGIHTGGSGELGRHGGHHIRVNHGNIGNIVHVHADKFAFLLHIRDHIIDGGFSGSTGGGGDGNGKDRAVFGGGNTFQRADVGKFRIVDDDADSFGSVDGGAAADGNHAVCPGFLVSRHAGLDVFDGGIGLNIGIDFIGEARFVQQISDFFGNAEFDQVRIRGNKGFFETFALENARDFFDRTAAVIGYTVENKTLNHFL